MAHENTPSSIVSRLAYLEKELRKVKPFAERQSLGQGAKKSTPLRGILKGIRIEPEEIEQVKKSVFLAHCRLPMGQKNGTYSVAPW